MKKCMMAPTTFFCQFDLEDNCQDNSSISMSVVLRDEEDAREGHAEVIEDVV